MLSYKFEYPVKATTEYVLKYGLDNKARPYFFNYPTGLVDGRYRFNYDRRDEVHLEDDEAEIVKWGSDIDISSETSLVQWGRNIDMEKLYQLEKVLGRQVVIDKPCITLDTTFNDLYVGYSKMLDKNFTKSLDINRDVLLDKIKEKLIDIYEAVLVEKIILKEIIMSSTETILSEIIEGGVKVHSPTTLLELGAKETCTFPIDRILVRANKGMIKGKDRAVVKINSYRIEEEASGTEFDTSYVELLYERIRDNLELNIFKTLDMFKDVKVLNENFTYNLLPGIEKTLLSHKQINELDIFKSDFPYFKSLREIIKGATEKIAFLVIREILKDSKSKTMELGEKLIDVFKDRALEKDMEYDMGIDDIENNLDKIPIHELMKHIESYLLQTSPTVELNIEKDCAQIEEVCEIILHVENRIKSLSKEDVANLFAEVDVHKLIKNLVVYNLATEREMKILEKGIIGQILIEEVFKLDKIAAARDIIIKSKSMPMVKAFKEINLDATGIETIKESIEIDISKENEFKKVVEEIITEDNETKIKFNKRFWFLRATDPFDFKILPFSDYPYSDKPIIFGEILIPDNWQLDMAWVPKLHEGISEHPVPFGSDLGRSEMALSIEIMVDVINIMILIWSRMFYNFSGYTGSQAVIRFTKILYDWLMLETSLGQMEEKESTEHYFRCYNWIRWEAEKVAIKARDDMSLSGNMYIDEWIFELIYYMENHHFDTMPIFDVVQKMDEYRALLPTDDPQGDINFVLDKVKGMRHKIIECKTNKSNE